MTHEMPQARLSQIRFLLAQLYAITPSQDTAYAVDANVSFFVAAQNIFKYAAWLWKCPKLDARRLLEINELIPATDRELHNALIEMERRPFPGLIKGAVDFLYQTVVTKNSARVRIGSLGSGGAEAERQLIQRILKSHADSGMRLTIIAFDLSDGAHDLAHENISSLVDSRVRICRVDSITSSDVLKIESEHDTPITVILAKNDIFRLSDAFEPSYFDILSTLLFLHHIEFSRKSELLQIMKTLSRTSLNYDGIRSNTHLWIQSIAGWKRPVFMNAAVFSNLRFSDRRSVSTLHKDDILTFYSHGHYRAVSHHA